LQRNAKLRQDFFENLNFSRGRWLVRPDKTEVKWHSFAAKSLVLSPKAQAGCRSALDGTEDKTPIIGDIPLVGRLFRTNVDQHIKRNLVIFVTARVITPAGLAFNNEEEEEEGLLPPALPEARRIRNRANHELTLIDTNQRRRTTDYTDKNVKATLGRRPSAL